jgi:hypothetical protein
MQFTLLILRLALILAGLVDPTCAALAAAFGALDAVLIYLRSRRPMEVIGLKL